tara:strand:- start:101 stop:820 length:720 start_codon:yes stop_codon:yes gene_type:complete
MPEVDYDAEYAKRIQLNQARMEQEILSGSKEIVNKIQSRLGMYGLNTTVADVLKELQGKIKSGLTPAEVISISEWAAVKPERQNLHENVALDALQAVYGKKIIKLPTRGAKAVFFSNGKIYSKKQDTDSKSIDFHLEYEDKHKTNWDIYMGHKFTQNVGGKQTQQNVEPDRDMRNAPKEKKLLFISIKDGEGASATLAKSVDDYEIPGRVYACKIQDVEKIITEVCDNRNPSFTLRGEY